jgi:hypothetical protein
VAFDKVARQNGLPQRVRQFITDYEGTPADSTIAYEHLIDSLPIDDLEQYEPRSDTMYASYGVLDASEVFL